MLEPGSRRGLCGQMLGGDEDRSGRQRLGERAAGGARASSGAGEVGGFRAEACEVCRFYASLWQAAGRRVCAVRAEDRGGGRLTQGMKTTGEGRGEGNPRSRDRPWSRGARGSPFQSTARLHRGGLTAAEGAPMGSAGSTRRSSRHLSSAHVPRRHTLLCWRVSFCGTCPLLSSWIEGPWSSKNSKSIIFPHPGSQDTVRVSLFVLTVVQSPSCVTPWTAAQQASLAPTIPKFAQVHVHCIGDVVWPSHPLPSSSPSAFNLSQYQSFPMNWLFTSGGQSIGAFQLQHQSSQWVFRVDFL